MLYTKNKKKWHICLIFNAYASKLAYDITFSIG